MKVGLDIYETKSKWFVSSTNEKLEGHFLEWRKEAEAQNCENMYHIWVDTSGLFETDLVGLTKRLVRKESEGCNLALKIEVGSREVFQSKWNNWLLIGRLGSENQLLTVVVFLWVLLHWHVSVQFWRETAFS